MGMKLTQAEKKSLEVMSELSDGNSIPAIRLKRDDKRKFVFAYLMTDLIRLSQPTEQKENKWNKEILPTH
jgi:hypothetical protein